MSEVNSFFDPARRYIYQDMNRPLHDYYIASSHNTYLKGEQYIGKSAVDQYITVLQLGCRCVELDCWNGPGDEPLLFHGVRNYKLTSSIYFSDVVQVCRDYGFQVPIHLNSRLHFIH